MRKRIYYIIILLSMISVANNASAQQGDMMIRISEIEVYPEYLQEYKEILKEKAAPSLTLEPGVIAIFPMSERNTPHQIRILEIYTNQEAYQLHLKTAHFLKYKTTTLKMVKSLRLVDMNAMDAESIKLMFAKVKTD